MLFYGSFTWSTSERTLGESLGILVERQEPTLSLYEPVRDTEKSCAGRVTVGLCYTFKADRFVTVCIPNPRRSCSSS